MKKTILSMAMLLTLSATVPALAQKHRHTPRTQMEDYYKYKVKDCIDDSRNNKNVKRSACVALAS